MLFYLTNSILDITYGATFWIFKKGLGGIYYGTTYLIYGNQDKEEIEMKNLQELTKEIKELKRAVSELNINKKPAINRSLSDSFIIINSRN
jgi:hypothetical protein